MSVKYQKFGISAIYFIFLSYVVLIQNKDTRPVSRNHLFDLRGPQEWYFRLKQNRKSVRLKYPLPIYTEIKINDLID